MKAAIVTMTNKVGQPFKKYYLLDESVYNYAKAEKIIFNKHSVYDYNQPNEVGNSVVDITLSCGVGCLSGIDSDKCIGIGLVENTDA